MKGFTSLSLAAMAGALGVDAHYIFQQFSAGGTSGGVFEYVRENSNYNSPVTDLSSTDLRCNEGGSTGSGTSTLEVAAGSDFTFDLDTAVYHQGATSVYMSRAPGAAADYDGSGGWFKIHDFAPIFSGSNADWQMKQSYTATIPSCVPDGEYLLRIHQLGIHNPYPGGIPQFYISCAQIKVTGGGSADPATVSIPGAFKESDPGYTANIYNGLTSYEVVGPAPFTC